MNNPIDIYLNQIDCERNIYEEATLFNQNRRDVYTYIDCLVSPGNISSRLILKDDGTLLCELTGKVFPINEHVIDFTAQEHHNQNWVDLNKQFLNYHKSLSIYTLINSTPLINYFAMHSGIGSIKNAKVIDVGGGTGHALCSFFQFPETLEYYLVDPNVRQLHDQFVRIYPKLTALKIAHIKAYSEVLPFKSNFADLVFSLSAIDHYSDYKAFIAESHRVLQPNGTLFIATHLALPLNEIKQKSFIQRLFSVNLLERLTRYLYFRKNKVGADDHTLHLKNTQLIEEELLENKFEIVAVHNFKRYFYIVAKKAN